MDISTQNFLMSKDTSKNDRGLTYKEVMKLDTNGDGRLSKQETSHHIGTRDLNALNQHLEASRKVQHQFSFITDDMVVYQRSALNTELFPGGVSGISAHDVDQGGVGDCYFLAAAAGLAEARPQDIVDMIQDNGNGSYTVDFPGFSKKITVQKPTAAELSKYAHKGKNGSTWVAVLEKAFAKYAHDKAWFKQDNRDELDGDTLGAGIHPLTGHSTNTDTLALTWKSTTRSRIEAALNKNRVVTASVNSLWGGDKIKDKHHLISNHVYTILDYDRSTDTLRLRNPWGWGNDTKGFQHSDGTNDGIFTMTMDEFYAHFSFIGYEEAH